MTISKQFIKIILLLLVFTFAWIGAQAEIKGEKTECSLAKAEWQKLTRRLKAKKLTDWPEGEPNQFTEFSGRRLRVKAFGWSGADASVRNEEWCLIFLDRENGDGIVDQDHLFAEPFNGDPTFMETSDGEILYHYQGRITGTGMNISEFLVCAGPKRTAKGFAPPRCLFSGYAEGYTMADGMEKEVRKSFGRAMDKIPWEQRCVVYDLNYSARLSGKNTIVVSRNGSIRLCPADLVEKKYNGDRTNDIRIKIEEKFKINARGNTATVDKAL